MGIPVIKALTIPYDVISRVLACSVTVLYPKSLLTPDEPQNTSNHIAIWDTGATGTAITESFAKKLGLIPTGLKDVSGLGGTMQKKTYLIDLILPDNIHFLDLPVSEIDNAKDKDGNVIDNFGILIGMDIITTGDLTITNFENKTTMSFRYPSQKKVDYVDEFKRRAAVEAKHTGKRPR